MLGNVSTPKCVVTQESAAKFEPLLKGTENEINDAIAKGAVDIS